MRLESVFITGADGFVGLHVLRVLAARGARVQGAGPGGPPVLPLAGWHVADLRDPDAIAAAIAAARADVVIHLAGQSSAGRSFEIPEETFTINTVGTWNLLEAVRRGAPRARVLIVGTGEVYGPQPEGTRVTEDAPFAPVSPYALSKAAADALAESHGRRGGLDVIRTRSFAHIGPGQTTRFVVPTFAEQIAAIEAGRSEPVLHVGNLDVTRDLTDVRDVVRAYLALIKGGKSGAAYNVCRGEGVKLTEVVRMMIARSRVPIRVEVDPARLRPADVPYLVGDASAIARDVGWRAEVPIERTIDEVLDEWRARAGGGS